MNETQNLDSLSGKALQTWCTHSMRLDLIGLPQQNSITISLERALRPDLRAIVFLDMDETLTAANVPPDEYFAEILDESEESSDAHVAEYMKERVPQPLKRRVSALLKALEKSKDIEWFILTDNIYPMTKCTMKLAFGFETRPGTIIDRTIRTHIDSEGRTRHITKSELIESFLAVRKQEGLPPVSVVFADNDPIHRKEVSQAMQIPDYRKIKRAIDEETESIRKQELSLKKKKEALKRQEERLKAEKMDSLVCCADLKTGLEPHHIQQIVDFLQLR